MPMCHRASFDSSSPCDGPSNTIITYLYNEGSDTFDPEWDINTFYYCNAHSNEVAIEYLSGRFSELTTFRAETMVDTHVHS